MSINVEDLIEKMNEIVDNQHKRGPIEIEKWAHYVEFRAEIISYLEEHQNADNA